MRIIFKGKDGSVAIMELKEGADKKKAIKDFTECHGDFYKYFSEGDVKLPESREFRDAWTISAKGSIIVDEKKVKLIKGEV